MLRLRLCLPFLFITSTRQKHHPNRPCEDSELNHVGFEGAYLCKANGRYYLSCAERYYARYHCMTAESRTLLGPYGPRYVSGPYASHNVFFQDGQGQWRSPLFGNDDDEPVRKRAAVVPIEFDKQGHIRPVVQ